MVARTVPKIAPATIARMIMAKATSIIVIPLEYFRVWKRLWNLRLIDIDLRCICLPQISGLPNRSFCIAIDVRKKFIVFIFYFEKANFCFKNNSIGIYRFAFFDGSKR